MERVCLLRVSPGGKVLATLRARQYGTDEWHTEGEWDVSHLLPGVLEALKAREPEPEAPTVLDEGGGEP